MTCNHEFGCHSCTNALQNFIDSGEKALKNLKINQFIIACEDLEDAIEKARLIIGDKNA